MVILCTVLFFCALAYTGCKSSDVKPVSSGNAEEPGSGSAAPDKVPTGPGSAGDTVPAATYYTHVVKWNGETVSIIAAWYTGDKSNWEVLAKHNPSIDPALIHSGMQILLPEDIMTTKKQMTREFVDSFYHSAKRRGVKKARDNNPPTTDDGIQIFGPKDPTVNIHGQGANEHP